MTLYTCPGRDTCNHPICIHYPKVHEAGPSHDKCDVPCFCGPHGGSIRCNEVVEEEEVTLFLCDGADGCEKASVCDHTTAHEWGQACMKVGCDYEYGKLVRCIELHPSFKPKKKPSLRILPPPGSKRKTKVF